MGLFGRKKNRVNEEARDQKMVKDHMKREQEKHAAMEHAYRFLRVFFDLTCLNIGVFEGMQLGYQPEGLIPQRTVAPISKEDIEDKRRVLTKLLKDMERMTGKTLDQTLEEFAPSFEEPEVSEDTGGGAQEDTGKEPQEQATNGDAPAVEVPIEGGKTPSGIIAA